MRNAGHALGKTVLLQTFTRAHKSNPVDNSNGRPALYKFCFSFYSLSLSVSVSLQLVRAGTRRNEIKKAHPCHVDVDGAGNTEPHHHRKAKVATETLVTNHQPPSSRKDERSRNMPVIASHQKQPQGPEKKSSINFTR